MSLNVSRTTEPLRFDTGIGNASFAEVADSPVEGQPQRTLPTVYPSRFFLIDRIDATNPDKLRPNNGDTP